jgi:hypothetical protein
MKRREFLALLSAIASASPATAIDVKMRDRVIAETTALFRAMTPSIVKPPGSKNSLTMISNDWTGIYQFRGNDIDLLKKFPIKNGVISGLFFNKRLNKLLNSEKIEEIMFYNGGDRDKIIESFKIDKIVPFVMISEISLYSPVFDRSFNRAMLVVMFYSHSEKTAAWTPGDKLAPLEFSIVLFVFEKRNGVWRQVGDQLLAIS